MNKYFSALIITLFFSSASQAQYSSNLSEQKWVDSVFRSLSNEQKITQLMVIRAHSNLGPEHIQGVTDLIRNYNVGALCFFQGGPVRQANLTNFYQSIAKTPLMITIDGEWGLGMRLDSVNDYPYQLTLGALTDEKLVYEMGVAVGKQMKRIGVHVNYAPVVDINNNPNNPVIGYRSFGEDRDKVALFGSAYARGMQDAGIMACAKHFPGHGDTEVDSHADLPLISKSLEQLDTLELYPFKQLFKAGVGSVMIAHLFIPAIDNTANKPTSLSRKNIRGLLRDDLDYEGLTFTDALEMKAVTKYFPAGEAAVQALIAGNDMLCLPEDVKAAIDAISFAIKKKRLRWSDIDAKVMKVLQAKYRLGLHRPQFVDTANLLEDLNRDTESIKSAVARNTVTVLHNEADQFPFIPGERIAYVGIGTDTLNQFGARLQQDFRADTFFFSYKDNAARAAALQQRIDSGDYNRVIIGIHNATPRTANNYGISSAAVDLWNSLQSDSTLTFLFANVYAAKNFIAAKTLVAMHQDDAAFQQAAADFMRGSLVAKGRLPVTVAGIPYGSGLVVHNLVPIGSSLPWLPIDSIMQDAIAQKAFPGAVVMAVHQGKIRYHKAFGSYDYAADAKPVSLESIYDVASLTKTSATTVAVMKLYEQGKLDLKKTLGDYLPLTQGTDKAGLVIEDILLHQAGLVPFIAFYKETMDSAGLPRLELYNSRPDSIFSVPVARGLYLRRDWQDTIMQRILASPLTAAGRYVYSDNDFIFLGKIVESITGMPLDQYVQKTFYRPLGMVTTGFNAGTRFGLERVVPTELEKNFRRQLLQGYVHDEGASLFGGVSGHAGLFSTAYDLSLLYQMLLNGGTLNGERFFKKETIDYFTAYRGNNSRRALGFDKPEKDNKKEKNPYPSLLASPETFGHTGFTGTCVWVDPKADLVYIFLSNRVHPTRENNKLSSLNVRAKVQDAIYQALQQEAAVQEPVKKTF